MDENKKNEIEARLRKLIEQSGRTQNPRIEESVAVGSCSVIRRRKGKKDERIPHAKPLRLNP
ncbi:MAG: hypothetical protein LJE63_15380 [Desulfobacteraceae bacterium]|jgi:hypothetical protein|nr:hypothetical protein [Desulfobacteraceae bacterium]